MPSSGAYFRRGGKLIDDPKQENISSTPQEEKSPSVPLVSDQSEGNKFTISTETADSFNYIAALLKAKGSIDPVTLAECIVGQIRKIYFQTSVRIPKVTDLEIMNYMDKILFDTLQRVLTAAIKYGTAAVPIELVLQLIENGVYSVDYQVDIELMNSVIHQVYAKI